MTELGKNESKRVCDGIASTTTLLHWRCICETHFKMTLESSFSTCCSDSCSESESSPDSFNLWYLHYINVHIRYVRDSSEYVNAVEEDSASEFPPYDDNIEPITTDEKRQKDMRKNRSN